MDPSNVLFPQVGSVYAAETGGRPLAWVDGEVSSTHNQSAAVMSM